MEVKIDEQALMEPNATDKFIVVNKKGLEQVLQLVNTITLGDYAVRVDPQAKKVAIYHESGEGGEFNFELFRDAVAAFYKEHF